MTHQNVGGRIDCIYKWVVAAYDLDINIKSMDAFDNAFW